MGTVGSPQHRLRRVDPERCAHYMRRGECVLASCPHYDGQGSPFEPERAQRAAKTGPGAPQFNGRTEAVFARVGADWARFEHSTNAVVRNRESVLLDRLVAYGRIERRPAPDDASRREYRRAP